MNDKGHFYISLAKSIVRIGGAVFATISGSISILAVSFGIAEVLGILEEVFDKR